MSDIDKKLKGPRVEIDGENYTFFFEDFRIQRVNYCFHHGVQICTYRNGYYFSFDNGAFIADGKSHIFNFREDLNSFRLFDSLLECSIPKLLADESGTLNVYFSNGAELKIPPADDVENWECNLFPGWHFGASPGGGVWVFPPDEKVLAQLMKSHRGKSEPPEQKMRGCFGIR